MVSPQVAFPYLLMMKLNLDCIYGLVSSPDVLCTCSHRTVPTHCVYCHINVLVQDQTICFQILLGVLRDCKLISNIRNWSFPPPPPPQKKTQKQINKQTHKLKNKVTMNVHYKQILIDTSRCNLQFFSELFTTQKRIFTWCHRKQSLLKSFSPCKATNLTLRNTKLNYLVALMQRMKSQSSFYLQLLPL